MFCRKKTIFKNTSDPLPKYKNTPDPKTPYELIPSGTMTRLELLEYLERVKGSLTFTEQAKNVISGDVIAWEIGSDKFYTNVVKYNYRKIYGYE